MTTSLRNYNKFADRWELIGADAGTGMQDFGTARRVGSEMHIEQQFAVASGQPAIMKIRYYNIEKDKFSWAADRSTDGGKTWVKNHLQIEARRIGPPRTMEPLATARKKGAFHIVPTGACGSGARHRRTRALDRSGLRGRAAGREATGVWLLQRRRGNRTSLQSGIRLLAFARVSKPKGCGSGQECYWNRGGGRRARVALRIRGPKQCAAGRKIHRRRRASAASRSKQLHSGSLLRCHAARRQFQSAYTPRPRRLVRAGGRAVSGDTGWR